MVLAAHGASFDCGMAKSAVEKEICGDAELSSLDDVLGREYRAALSGASGDAARVIRGEQRDWIRRRNSCDAPRKSCLVREYNSRIQVLRASNGPSTASSRNAGRRVYQTESQRLQEVFKAVGGRKFKPHADWLDRPYCKQALVDIGRQADLTPIEPWAIVESDDDEKLADWHECDKAGEHDVKDRSRAYLGLYMIGSGPYRYYRLDVDGNGRNGHKSILYNEDSKAGPTSRQSSFNWVNFSGCSFEGRVILEQNHAVRESEFPELVRASALARYRSDVIVLEAYPAVYGDKSRKLPPYQISLYRLKAGKPYQCVWDEDIGTEQR